MSLKFDERPQLIPVLPSANRRFRKGQLAGFGTHREVATFRVGEICQLDA